MEGRRFLLLLPLLVLNAPTRTASTAPQETTTEALVVHARPGDVTRVEREAWVRPRGETSPKPLLKGAILAPGDVVTTGPGGSAEWSLGPDSYMRVAGSSRVKVGEVRPEDMAFGVEEGRAFAVITRLADGASVVIETPLAIFFVAGKGSYEVGVARGGETEAAAFKGELRFIDRRGRTVRVRRGHRVRLSLKAAEN
jgi:hypothetical protein